MCKIHFSNLAILLCFLFFLPKASVAQRHAMLDSIVNVLENKSIYKEHFDRTKYESIILASDEHNFETVTIPLIQQMLTDIGDEHGRLFYNNRTFPSKRESVSLRDSLVLKYAFDEAFAFRSAIVADRYSYIAIPSPQIPMEAFSNQQEAIQFISAMAQQIQDTLCATQSQPLEGIILDLRLSMGGNLPLLLNSVGAFIPDGDLFDVMWGDGITSTYRLSEGKLFEGDNYLGSTAHKCDAGNHKIAVLIGPLNSSASAQTAIAFKGLENVKFFGEETNPYTSNITSLIQSDDGIIFTYAAGVIRDRDGVLYEHSVRPDVVVEGSNNFESLEEDAKVKAAIEWFRER